MKSEGPVIIQSLEVAPVTASNPSGVAWRTVRRATALGACTAIRAGDERGDNLRAVVLRADVDAMVTAGDLHASRLPEGYYLRAGDIVPVTVLDAL